MVLGLAVSFFISYRRAKRASLSTDHLTIIAAMCFLGALVGAKLLYIVVTYTPSEFIQALREGHTEELLGGGLVFYGGLIGGVLAAPLGAKIAGTKTEKCRLKPYVDAVVPSLPFAHAIGRIGCYLGGCCYGFPYDGPLASRYYYIAADGNVAVGYAFPTQLVESGLNVCLGIFLLLYSRKRKVTLKLYMTVYAVIRFCLEFLRGDEKRGSFLMFSTSQWISLAIIAVCTALTLAEKLAKGSHAKSEESSAQED